MASWAQHFCTLIWLITLYTAGIYFFSRGFLLKRIVLDHHSHCNQTPAGTSVDLFFKNYPHSASHWPCWIPHKFSRAIVIIIDGLRYDFIRWNDSVLNPAPYQNKLYTVHEILTERPSHGKLYKFIADPPTTTMQRIKGLTTGSLPTFIDMGANFASYEIKEDNLIDQLRSIGKKIIFMGDDTWDGLFPGRFESIFAFPSFNTRDLNTVDDGILERLIPSIKGDNWNMIIAHFLGVDHCGHTFGPDHPAMGAKLNQLDLILKSVVNNLPSETVLVVLGDHGMSSSGDHGGDTVDEVTSGLFVYSSEQIFKETLETTDTEVMQIDLVPTLALILGVPIPFGNLGTVIPDVVPTTDVDSDFTNAALYLNAAQINEYLKSYVTSLDEFPSSDWEMIQRSFKGIERKIEELMKNPDEISIRRDLKLNCIEFTKQALTMCRRLWATFDTTSMAFGIFIITAAITSSLMVLVVSSVTPIILCGTLIAFGFAVQLTTSHESFAIDVGSFGFVLAGLTILGWSKRQHVTFKPFTNESIISLIIMSICMACVFSNSFIVSEAYELLCLLHIATTVAAISTPKRIPQTNKRKEPLLTIHQMFRLICLLLYAIVMRFAMNYQRCREEQHGCVEPSAGTNSNYLLAISSVVALTFTFLSWMNGMGNLSKHSVTLTLIKYLMVTIAACVCYYWALLTLPDELRNKLSPWQQVWVPRGAFGFIFVNIATIVIRPVCIYVVPGITYFQLRNLSASSIPQMYNHMKQNWRQHFGPDNTNNSSIPAVYGLATVYSSGMLVAIMSVVLLLILLTGQSHAVGVVLAVIALFVALTLLSTKKTESSITTESLFEVSWISVIIWNLQSSYFFYTTGHQASISSIQWNAAFIGTEGEIISYMLPAIKIILNTFASHVIYGLSVTLLVIWPFTCHSVCPVFGFRAPVVEVETQQGELTLFNKGEEFRNGVFHCTVKFIVLQGLKILATMCAATLHRRHLMVWKLFAPRFIFEGLATLITLIATVLGFLMVARIHKCVCGWVDDLEKRSKR